MTTLREFRETILPAALKDQLSTASFRLPVEIFAGDKLPVGAPAAVIYQGYDGSYIDTADPGADYCRAVARFSVLLIAGAPYTQQSTDRLDDWVIQLPSVAARATRAITDGDGPVSFVSASAPLVTEIGNNRATGVVARLTLALHNI